jgi:hypothetical protein
MQIPSQLPYILSLSDLFLTPLYIVILLFIIIKIKKRYYADSPLKIFILPAFAIHVFGCIFFALVYQYYYGYGDMYGYFTGAHETWTAFLKDPRIAFELVFKSRENFSETAMNWAPYSSFLGFAGSLSVMIKIASVVGLFCFGSYLPIALVFTLFSFWGTWLMYITINKYFPHLYKFTGIACLFIPSVIIWSSGVTKEAPCMFALGLCFYSFDQLLRRKRFLKSLFLLFIGAIILYNIKSYLLFTFAAAAFIWWYRSFIFNLHTFFFRLIVRGLFFIFLVTAIIYSISVADNFVQETITNKLSAGENLQEMMTSINNSEGGSGYQLPPFNLSVGGVVKSFFQSLNVALFRPYLWECTNVLMLLSFAESFATFLLVLFTIFKVGFRKLIFYCKMPLMVFMLLFSLILAPIAGFISFNFGTLVRYKIPLLPFFILFFVIILFDSKYQAAMKKVAQPDSKLQVL